MEKSSTTKKPAHLDDPRYLAPEDREAAPLPRRIDPDALLAHATVRQTGERLTRAALPTSFQGQSLEVEWSDTLGQSGLPWSLGQLRLEQRPDLYPVYARGRRGQPGEYQKKARANPWIQNRLRSIIYPVASAPWKITRPKDCPDDQWDFQQACWAAWTERGAAYGLADWLQDAVWMALVAGFGWAEIVWPEGAAVPPLPPMRDPSSVDEWVLQADTWLGVVQSVNSVDSYGNVGPVRVVIPAQKLLHWANEPIGPTDLEGCSLLRPAYTPLQLCEDLLSLQGLSAALNAAGTWVVEADRDAPEIGPDGRTNLANHFLAYQAQHAPYLILPPGYRARLESPDSAVVDVTAQLRLAEQAAMTAMSGAHDLIAAYGQGSRAARESASGDARDLLDVYAGQMGRVLERLLRRLLVIRFPSAVPIPAVVTYGDVETRSNAEAMNALATYLRDVRPVLWPDARKMYDEALSLPPEPTAEVSETVTDGGISEADRALQIRLAFPDGSLYLEPEVANAMRSALGLPPWTEAQRAEWIAQKAALSTAAPAPTVAPPIDGEPIRSLRAAEPDSLPVPKGVQEEAQRALGWLEEGYAGEGFTDVGRQRAAQLARGGPVSPETVRRMAKFFNRFRGQRAEKHALQDGKPTPWRVAWDAWGGDAGDRWSARLVESWDSEDGEE